MRKWAQFFIIGAALASFMFTGCAKQEKAREETKKPKITKRPVPSDKPITEERVLFDFSQSLSGWEIPAWVAEKDDYVAENMEISEKVANEGSCSMKIDCDFSGKKWTAAFVELEQFYDFSPYREIAVDIYLPKNAPLGLKGKIILTVGENWRFVEMNYTVPLVPGEWVTIRGNIEPGSYDWKRIVPDESFRADVRKIAVRIESNKNPVYKGPIYIDNVRIGK